LGALKRNSDSCRDIIGCSIQFFREWIEFQFYDNISWENQGKHWHLDHVIPCITFDLVDINQQRFCFNWKNYQPLRSDKNQSKRNKRCLYMEMLQELKAKVFVKQNDLN